MSLSTLPAPVLALLRALQTRDRAALSRVLSPTAVLHEDGRTYEGAPLLAWLERCFPGEPGAVQAVDEHRSGEGVVLTLATGELDPAGADVEQEWTLALQAGEIAAIAVERRAGLALPGAVAAFVRATNRHDLAGLVRAFHAEALVNDQLRNHWGRDAIRRWAEQDVIGAELRLHVVGVVEHHGHTIVSAHVNGSFDRRGLPDPLVLSLYCSHKNRKIIMLIILQNRPEL